MKPTELIDKCLANPIHANCKKFLITLENGSNGKCTQVPNHRDITEVTEESGHNVLEGTSFRYVTFYDISTDTTTYFVQRN
nr:hypothetical protein [Herbaspirillum sp. ASV7]